MRAINEGVYDWDIASGTVYYSDWVRRALGLSADELKTAADWRNRIHPEDLPRFDAALIAHLKGQTDRFECDFRYRARDGSWRWARQHGFSLRDPRGRAIRMIGSTGDITELKQTAEALRISEERYALAMRAATEGVYEWDPASGRLYISDTTKVFFWSEAGAPTSETWNSRVHPEDFPAYRQAVTDHLRGRTPHMEHEYRLRDAAGGYLWVLDRGVGVRDADGRVTKFVGAVSDITPRKRAEQELRRAHEEQTAALEQQTATAEILKVISGSPTNVQPVFDAIAHNAASLCDSLFANVFRFDGELVYWVSSERYASQMVEILRSTYPVRPNPSQVSGRVILTRAVVRMEDARSDPDYDRRFTDAGGWRRILGVPMLRDGEPIGAIVVGWAEAGPILPRHEELLKTFADQAVIAIENVRLFRELDASNRGLARSLEHQTAMGDVLRAISASPTAVKPVLDALATRAAHLCGAAYVNVLLEDGDILRTMAVHSGEGGPVPDLTFTMRATHATVNGRAFLESRVIHVEDFAAVAQREYPDAVEIQRKFGFRTILGVPMLREGKAIGTISIWRREVRPFSEDEIALMQTFADQAVIAIENVRLFNETKEALERQTATADILRVISSSPTEVRPVLEAVAASAARLCEASDAIIAVREGDELRFAVHYGTIPNLEIGGTRRISRGTAIGRSVLEGRQFHIADLQAEAVAFPEGSAYARQFGYRTLLVTPLMREGEAIGTIMIRRIEARPFGDKQIALMQTFADQAVIAIENVRLFHEVQSKSTQLEAANRHKSEFLANMSHELRTLLNAIIGFSEVLGERYFGELTEKQDEYVKDIHSSGRHLLSLINDILDLSKIEAGRMELDLAEFDLRSVIDNALTLVKERAQRHGITLSLAVESGLGSIRADERKFKQIMLNLLSNAVKFAPDGGAVSVHAQTSGAMLEISVSDTGLGIAPEDHAAVFEEFKQVGPNGAHKAEGTGLGMPLTRRFIELHGGAIRLESALGQGAKFTFQLPLHR